MPDLEKPRFQMGTRVTVASGLWYFRVWNFKFAHSKLVRPKGSNERNLSDFSILCQIEESRASEGWKIKSLKNEIMKFYKWNSNSFSKTISNINPDVWSRSDFGHKKSKFRNWQDQKLIIFKIWFNTSIAFIFLNEKCHLPKFYLN